MAEAQTNANIDQLEHLTAKADELDAVDLVRFVLAQVERLLDGVHRQRPGQPAGANDKQMDRVRHVMLQSKGQLTLGDPYVIDRRAG